MSQAKVMQPLVVTSTMLVASSLFETAPAVYAAGTTYDLYVYASVAGALGELLIYKSLRSGNTGNTPSSSPTSWVYSSSTYGVYNAGTTYSLGHRVIDTVSRTVKESLFASNSNNPVNNTSKWNFSGKINYPLTTPQFSSGATYVLGALVIDNDFTTGDSDHIIQYLYKSLQANNLGKPTSTSTAWWRQIGIVYPLFSLYATYALGERVTDSSGSVYECKEAGTIGKPLAGQVSWLEIAPSNNIAMFDKQTATKSIANKEISFTVNSGIIDTVGMVGLDADMAVVTVRNGLAGAIVFTKTVGLTGGNPTNAWDYYFSEPTLRRTQIVVDGIPPYVNSHVTITLTGGAAISVGNVFFGKNKDIGLAQYGLTAGIIDFSVKTTDAFGATTFVKRGFKKKVNVRTFVDNTALNLLQNLLYNLRAEPCLWQFSDDPDLSEATILYGYYKDFSTDISYPTNSYVNIEIEGLI